MLAPQGLRAQSAPQMRVASTTDFDVMSAVYGAESGAFTRVGLDVSVQRANSGAAVAAAVIGGAFEIGKSSTMGLVNAHAHGIPVVIVATAAIYSTSVFPGAATMLVAKDGPIHSGADLNGQTLSVTALNDLFSVAMSAWADQHGGDSRTLKFIELPNSAAAEAIASGRVATATLADPQLSAALSTGRFRILGYSFDAIAPRFLSAAFFCTEDYLAHNRDAIARFRSVIAASAQYITTHPTETIDMVARFTGLDRNAIAATTRTPLGGPLDPALLQPLIDRAAQYKAIPARFDARDLIDPAAYRGR